MKFYKAMFGIFVSAIMLITLSLSVHAASTTEVDENEYLEYARKATAGYVGDGTMVKVTNGYSVHNGVNPNIRVFFVFNNSKCVGHLCVDKVDGTFASSYTKYSQEDTHITDALTNNTPISLHTYDDRVWMLIGDYCSLFYGPRTDNVPMLQADDGEVISLFEIKDRKSAGQTRAPTQHMLNVNFVPNSDNPDGGVRLCWAASAACVITYREPQFYPLSALNVYYMVKQNYGGGHTVNSTYVDKAFSHYGVPVSFRASGLTFDEIANSIYNGRPVYAALGIPNVSVGHAVVICGYRGLSDGTYSYSIMDPDAPIGGFTSAEVPNPYNGSIRYVAPNYSTYTIWRKSYY